MSASAFYEKIKGDMAKMKEMTPHTVSGFGGLFSKVMAEGTLTVREKELIALGIAVGAKCEPCIMAHVQKSLAAGAKKEEILEAAEVAVVMGGGPAYMHLPAVIDALEACGA